MYKMTLDELAWQLEYDRSLLEEIDQEAEQTENDCNSGFISDDECMDILQTLSDEKIEICKRISKFERKWTEVSKHPSKLKRKIA